MRRRPNEQTKVLVSIFEDRINHFAGDLTIQIDDIQVEFRARMGGRLGEAQARVRSAMASALAILHEDGVFAVRVTEFYWNNRDNWPHRHPQTQAEIVRSVAVSSGGAGTFAIHFCPSDDCVLFMQAFDHNTKSGERKVRVQVSRMGDMAESGLLTPDAVAKVAANAGLSPRKDVNRVVRIAARRQQLRLKAGDEARTA